VTAPGSKPKTERPPVWSAARCVMDISSNFASLIPDRIDPCPLGLFSENSYGFHDGKHIAYSDGCGAGLLGCNFVDASIIGCV